MRPTYEQGQGQGQGQGRKPILPKFGEWNVNDPASADGYTVVFTKARDERKAKATVAPSPPPPTDMVPTPTRPRNQSYDHTKRKWICCFKGSNAVEDI
ncbi:hypothetical protein ACS0TY_006648 [Phlomoides rotata]